MANLTSGSILTGNIISASDITTLYDVFTGAQTYENINIPTGSIFNSTSASYATSASQAANAVNADNIAFTADSTNTNRYVSFTSTAVGDGTLFTDAGLLYNPNSNTLTTTNFTGTSSLASLATTASYVAGANVDGVVDSATTASNAVSSSVATGLEDFRTTNRSGTTITTESPKPIAASISITDTSGSLDLSAIGVGSGATDLGEHIWFNINFSSTATEMDTAVDLAVTWSAPTLEVTGSAGLTGVAIVTGWYSGSIA